MNRLPLLLVSWVNWEDRSHWPSVPHWGLPLPFSTASNLSWFVKVCVSSFCLTSAVPLLFIYLLSVLSLCSVVIHQCKSHPCATSAIRKGISLYHISTWLQTVLPMQQCLGITCQLWCCTRNSRGAVHHYLHPSGCCVPGWCLPGCLGCEQPLSLRDLHCWDQGQQQFSQNEVWKLIAEPAPFLCLGNACLWCRATDVKALQVDWGRDLVLSVFGGFDFSCVSYEN